MFAIEIEFWAGDFIVFSRDFTPYRPVEYVIWDIMYFVRNLRSWKYLFRSSEEVFIVTPLVSSFFCLVFSHRELEIRDRLIVAKCTHRAWWVFSPFIPLYHWFNDLRYEHFIRFFCILFIENTILLVPESYTSEAILTSYTTITVVHISRILPYSPTSYESIGSTSDGLALIAVLSTGGFTRSSSPGKTIITTSHIIHLPCIHRILNSSEVFSMYNIFWELDEPTTTILWSDYMIVLWEWFFLYKKFIFQWFISECSIAFSHSAEKWFICIWWYLLISNAIRLILESIAEDTVITSTTIIEKVTFRTVFWFFDIDTLVASGDSDRVIAVWWIENITRVEYIGRSIHSLSVFTVLIVRWIEYEIAILYIDRAMDVVRILILSVWVRETGERSPLEKCVILLEKRSLKIIFSSIIESLNLSPPSFLICTEVSEIWWICGDYRFPWDRTDCLGEGESVSPWEPPLHPFFRAESRRKELILFPVKCRGNLPEKIKFSLCDRELSSRDATSPVDRHMSIMNT